MIVDAQRIHGLVQGKKWHAQPATEDDIASLFQGWRVAAIQPVRQANEVRHWWGRRVVFVQYLGGGVIFSRAVPFVASEYDATVHLTMVTRGSLRLIRHGRTTTVAAGSAVLQRFDTTDEAIVEAGSVLNIAVISIRALEARGVDVRKMDTVVWPSGPIERIGLQMAEAGWELADSSSDAAALESAIFELIVGRLSKLAAEGDDVLSQTRRRAANIIEERFTDPSLDAEALARMLGVSRRYLYSLFEESDSSVAGLIRHRRVLHAQTLLHTDPEMALRQVAELSGLTSEDRLLRTFKSLIGMSPSAFRRAVRAERVNAVPAAS